MVRLGRSKIKEERKENGTIYKNESGDISNKDGGVNPSDIQRLEEAISENSRIIEETRVSRAGIENFGLSKICPVGTMDATEADGLVCGAMEKNASVEGSLANEISNTKALFQNVGTCFRTYIVRGTSGQWWGEFEKLYKNIPGATVFTCICAAGSVDAMIGFKATDKYGAIVQMGYRENVLATRIIVDGVWKNWKTI